MVRLAKPNALLVKAHSSWDIGDREHRRHRAVLLLVERINFFLCHSAPFVSITF
jgi:hypothetical protein